MFSSAALRTDCNPCKYLMLLRIDQHDVRHIAVMIRWYKVGGESHFPFSVSNVSSEPPAVSQSQHAYQFPSSKHTHTQTPPPFMVKHQSRSPNSVCFTLKLMGSEQTKIAQRLFIKMEILTVDQSASGLKVAFMIPHRLRNFQFHIPGKIFIKQTSVTLAPNACIILFFLSMLSSSANREPLAPVGKYQAGTFLILLWLRCFP